MRTKKNYNRDVIPDLKYNSVSVAKLINRVMVNGKKSVAEALVYEAFEIVKQKTNQDGVEQFDLALENITPKIEVRSRRVGGAAYQVPTPVKGKRAFALAIRWLVLESKKRPNSEFHTFSEKLAAEIMDAASNQGGSIQKKLTMHKMAEANKAFAHFARF
jgi:small subunit ribosomal protein S7